MPPPAPPKFINSFCKRSIKPKFFKFSRAIIMGCFYQILLLMIFLFMSTHILIIAADSSSLDPVDYFKKFVKVGSDDDYEKNQIEKVSGLEDDEKGETLIVQKFRALFGFGAESPRSNDEDASFSPSPSPAPSAEEAESPAPAPLPPIARPRSPAHRPHLLPEPQKVKNDGNKGILKKILVSVFVSAGAAVVVSALVLVCFSSKFGKHRSKVLFYKRRGKSKYNGSQRSTTKLNLNPGLDFLYLESLEKDLEQQATVVKQNPETVTALPKEEVETRTESPRSSSSSSTKEITSVHEDEVDSAKNEFDGGGDESVSSVDKAAAVVAADECHSSDDESFHSFADSNSHTRLSNASAGSLSEAKANSSSNFDDKNSETQQAARDHTSDLISTSMARCDALSVSASSVCSKQSIPPPPPPPPPPLPLAMPPSKRLPPSFASARPTRITSKPSTSLTKQNDLPFSPGRSPKASQVRKSIPPPPSPPPFPQGNSSNTKGPPSPPSLLPNYTPLGKDGAPLPKLKPLHWDKVRAAPDRGMVWDKIRSSSFELDEEMIESLFGYNIQNAMRNEEAKSKTPSPSKHVLEPKRLQNITILFKALNSTAEQVCEALIRGDGLCLQQLEALVKMVPTKEEEAKLAEYKGSINELGSTEKFVKKLLSIPFAFSRVEAMLYKETFEDEVVHLRNSFSMLEEACKELRSSRLFLKLLEAVLKTGNRMNVGTIRGGARAFKLDALLKLADVKGTDGKTTLLHFVVQEIIRSEGVRVSDSIMGKISQKSKTNNNEEKEEYYRRMGLDLVSGLSTELYNVKKTATIDVDVLANSVSNLSSGMAKLHDLIHNELSSNDMDINFVKTMKKFLNYTERNVKELKEDEDRVMLNVREITEYFHGDVSKEEANPLRIFVIVRDFLGMLDHVCKELRSFKVPNSPSPLAPFR